MEDKIAEEISQFRSRATKEEFRCLVDRIFEVIDDAKDNVIFANTFEGSAGKSSSRTMDKSTPRLPRCLAMAIVNASVMTM